MSVRVVARIRPQLSSELVKDTIVSATCSGADTTSLNTVRIPNPRNGGEEFTFQFHGVYDQEASQQEIFDAEVAPTIKHLFGGFDITLFAYGVTGTGKTHTMRGGKTLAERGVIPRMLSGIYRRARKIEKDSLGKTSVEVAMSYYEIYNDRVFDLFEAPEKRTATGLQLRDNGGKTVVVGLTERPCESLKEFERLYDAANVNRSTSATKLNAHSSRSHAILCVKLSVTTGDEMRISTASAIDLAGSEDNRRTDNGKERLVESASINKSLFVLAQCVEAISRKQARIPYRESKMTRILSLGQNNGLTIMILNLAPVKSYHLDTLSSLNFANRTKKVEVREIENEPVFKGCPRAVPTFSGPSIQRQPLRPLASTVHNATMHASKATSKHGDKIPKAFSVYSDKSRPRQSNPSAHPTRPDGPRRSSPLKRPSDHFNSAASRPSKVSRSSPRRTSRDPPTMSKESIEEIIEKKVTEILAAQALDQPSIAPVHEISEEVQRRLDLLEQRIEGKKDGREQGLEFLLMAKQHHVRGEDGSALKMYQLAKDFFPDNAKLDAKIERLRGKLSEKKQNGDGLKKKEHFSPGPKSHFHPESTGTVALSKKIHSVKDDDDDDYQDPPPSLHDAGYDSPDSFHYKSRRPKNPRNPSGSKPAVDVFRDELSETASRTPRTRHILDIVNTRDVAQIRLLKGVGAKKAELILEALWDGGEEGVNEGVVVGNLSQLGRLRGVGLKAVERMREGVLV